MSEYKRIPGVESLFTDAQIRALIEHFHCKTGGDLIKAARRYESLFFCFDYETDGWEPRPYDVAGDMKLALAFAELVFSNLRETEEDLVGRHWKRPMGRPKSDLLPPDISEKFREARASVSTNELAVKRLIDLGVLKPKPNQHGKTPSAKSILRAIQQHEKRQAEISRQLAEDFKDFDFSDYD